MNCERKRSEFENDCKIFVGGLAPETTTESLGNYFSTYGNLLDCIVMIDLTTRKSRCFGFVTYENVKQMEDVLNGRTHTIDGKEVDCKKARRVYKNANVVNNKRLTYKIFVGGLPQISTETFRKYFEKFGQVVDAVIINDKVTGKHRGFGFVTFSNTDTVEELMNKGMCHELDRKIVEVKKAFPKEDGGGNGEANFSVKSPVFNGKIMYQNNNIRKRVTDTYGNFRDGGRNANRENINGLYAQHKYSNNATKYTPYIDSAKSENAIDSRNIGLYSMNENCFNERNAYNKHRYNSVSTRGNELSFPRSYYNDKSSYNGREGEGERERCGSNYSTFDESNNNMTNNNYSQSYCYNNQGKDQVGNYSIYFSGNNNKEENSAYRNNRSGDVFENFCNVNKENNNVEKPFNCYVDMAETNRVNSMSAFKTNDAYRSYATDKLMKFFNTDGDGVREKNTFHKKNFIAHENMHYHNNNNTPNMAEYKFDKAGMHQDIPFRPHRSNGCMGSNRMAPY